MFYPSLLTHHIAYEVLRHMSPLTNSADWAHCCASWHNDALHINIEEASSRCPCTTIERVYIVRCMYYLIFMMTSVVTYLCYMSTKVPSTRVRQLVPCGLEIRISASTSRVISVDIKPSDGSLSLLLTYIVQKRTA